MDQWQALRQYEERQRQERAARERLREEERQQAALQEQARNAAREKERQEAEQRRLAELQMVEQQAQEKRQREEAAHRTMLAQSAETLRIANQRAQEAQQIAAQKSQEQQAQKDTVWIACDGRKFRSPREQEFWEEWISDAERLVITPLIPQHHIGRYFADFAHLQSMTAIEIDGHSWHSERRAINKDYARQHVIEAMGWRVKRFTGDQVKYDLHSCIQITLDLIRERVDTAR